MGEGVVGEAVADDALRTGMAGRAIGPGYDKTEFPRVSAGEDAG